MNIFFKIMYIMILKFNQDDYYDNFYIIQIFYAKKNGIFYLIFNYYFYYSHNSLYFIFKLYIK